MLAYGFLRRASTAEESNSPRPPGPRHLPRRLESNLCPSRLARARPLPGCRAGQSSGPPMALLPCPAEMAPAPPPDGPRGLLPGGELELRYLRPGSPARGQLQAPVSPRGSAPPPWCRRRWCGPWTTTARTSNRTARRSRSFTRVASGVVDRAARRRRATGWTRTRSWRVLDQREALHRPSTTRASALQEAKEAGFRSPGELARAGGGGAPGDRAAVRGSGPAQARAERGHLRAATKARSRGSSSRAKELERERAGARRPGQGASWTTASKLALDGEARSSSETEPGHAPIERAELMRSKRAGARTSPT